MATSSKIATAQQLYDAGLSLYQENRYPQALAELKKAEDAFRKSDARGHPYTIPLPNGVSGLANTLALEGLCHQKLGDFRSAVRCYETSLINARFEKQKPFRTFHRTLNEHLLLCYEKEAEERSAEALARILAAEPEIDTAYRFPFSLNAEGITLARLYELSPDRHARFKDFYARAKTLDAETRRRSKRSDEASMRKMSFAIWGVLLAIFAVYGVMVAEALIRQNK